MKDYLVNHKLIYKLHVKKEHVYSTNFIDISDRNKKKLNSYIIKSPNICNFIDNNVEKYEVQEYQLLKPINTDLAVDNSELLSKLDILSDTFTSYQINRMKTELEKTIVYTKLVDNNIEVINEFIKYYDLCCIYQISTIIYDVHGYKFSLTSIRGISNKKLKESLTYAQTHKVF